jgi:hypothetical protein
MSVTFNNLSAAAVVIADHLFPEDPGETYPMIVGRTMGGAVKTANLGAGVDHIDKTLSFRLGNTDYEALRDFIQDTVVWSEGSFTFTDSNGTAFTNMHYISGLESFRRIRLLWSGRLRLAKDMSA